ncbi:FAD/NAD(P)-binding domain-containing protein [Xylaria telfairii]|nr:FAD/NAD(P)-binding domain-containing protein [Xylaria telfairii]
MAVAATASMSLVNVASDTSSSKLTKPAVHPLKELPLDTEKITARYQAERQKRLRADGVAQFKPTTGSFSRFKADPDAAPPCRDPITSGAKVLIVGAGIGGLVAAVKLLDQGVDDFLIIDKASRFGGTWAWNQFPGAACDVESYLYLPFLEETGYLPKRRFSYSPEILEHFDRIVAKWDLGPKSHLQTEITSMVWDEGLRRWHTKTAQGDHFISQFVITATGTLHEPKLPGFPGINDFQGDQFHSGRWDYHITGGDTTGNLDKLADKTVALVGTGATSIQILPFLAKSAKKVLVFQRTPSSVTFRENWDTKPDMAASLKPGWQANGISNMARIMEGDTSDIECTAVEGMHPLTRREIVREGRAAGVEVKDEEVPQLLQLADFRLMQSIRDDIDRQVHDKATAEKLKPWYPFMCKRPAFHNSYIATFNEPNVELVDTDGQGVSHLTRDAIVANGEEYAVDLVIYSTGFDFIFANDFERRTGIRMVGAKNQTIDEAWAEKGPSTLWGIHVRDFPNSFNVGAMQAGVGVTWLHTCYAAGEHIATVISKMLQQSAFEVVEPSLEASEAWGKQMEEGVDMRTMFLSSCPPGYYNKEGKPEEVSPRCGTYPKGVSAWVKILEDWRQEGTMKGLETR